MLKSGPAPVDGRYRVAALSWPAGIIVGRTEESGVRGDDPNDLITTRTGARFARSRW